MNWHDLAIWGFGSTVVLTTIMSLCQGAGFTRMSVPYMLGTMFTPDRDRAKVAGFAVHLLNGWLFALAYAAAFESWGAGWKHGMAIGAVHALFVLTAGMRYLPGLHPRMAREDQGPEVVRGLEPPGLLALNYGVSTPLIVLAAHLVYGGMLGFFYRA